VAADASGNWSLTPALSKGNHSIMAEATNSGGYTSLLSGVLTVSVQGACDSGSRLSHTRNSPFTSLLFCSWRLHGENPSITSKSIENLYVSQIRT
jgi:hypothetical protein